jgi:hypothetical protein
MSKHLLSVYIEGVGGGIEHMAIFPLQGIVYMVIASCIIYANSGYFKFDKVGI